ncbi:MAG: 3-phosphoserine/phosphohydroxythreonine transaminase [Oscillospiraceae bacterium]|nr:3-phosphoserine/phosphohydroxythreonine transaminase [Oscillospiraceae bacterium]
MRVYNFSAGPSALPEEVLKRAQDEMVEYPGAGMSVMEMSHRSKEYEAIINDAERLVRELMNVPDNYKVLFLQGGASSQFAMIPMNLCKNGKADYVITGQWAKKAASEAEKYLKVNRVASSADKTFSYIPKLDKSAFDPEADYFHITYNNTIYGTHYTELPDTGNVPLVADISSCVLAEKIDVSKFGLLYAGAQKNLGPAGVTLVIVRDDLIREDLPESVPTMFKYKIHADNGSMYNTPPTYAIYILKLVLEWVKEKGGVEELQKINEKKAAALYDYLDNSEMFKGTVVPEDRSLMNIPFVTGNDELDAEFVKKSKAAGLMNLKGHRTVGGMRASIYNAMTVEGVNALIDFMKKFESENK